MRNIFFIGYIFTCGHGCPPDAIHRKHNRICCPICGQYASKKVYRCSECGLYFRKTCGGGAVKLCDSCSKEPRYGVEIKPPCGFDQTRRGECHFGIYCVDQQLKTGIKFNCHGCRRFELLSLDVLDYMSAGVDMLEQGSNMAAI